MRGIHTIRDAGEMRGITNANFSYDAAGNLTASPVGYSYTWNAEGRMATAVAGGVTYTYTYNGDGQRVKKAAGSPSAHDKLYWYGLGGEVLAESALDGTLTSKYIFMGDCVQPCARLPLVAARNPMERIARRDVASGGGGGNVYYFLGDRLGNARIVTNSTGGIVEESDFLPYGTERTITDSLDNNYKFTGHERDGETSQDHTLWRQFASNTGRWLSADSLDGELTDPQSWNRFAYVRNIPTDFTDPLGQEWVRVCSGPPDDRTCWLEWRNPARPTFPTGGPAPKNSKAAECDENPNSHGCPEQDPNLMSCEDNPRPGCPNFQLSTAACTIYRDLYDKEWLEWFCDFFGNGTYANIVRACLLDYAASVDVTTIAGLTRYLTLGHYQCFISPAAAWIEQNPPPPNAPLINPGF